MIDSERGPGYRGRVNITEQIFRSKVTVSKCTSRVRPLLL